MCLVLVYNWPGLALINITTDEGNHLEQEFLKGWCFCLVVPLFEIIRFDMSILYAECWGSWGPILYGGRSLGSWKNKSYFSFYLPNLPSFSNRAARYLSQIISNHSNGFQSLFFLVTWPDDRLLGPLLCTLPRLSAILELNSSVLLRKPKSELDDIGITEICHFNKKSTKGILFYFLTFISEILFDNSLQLIISYHYFRTQ